MVRGIAAILVDTLVPVRGYGATEVSVTIQAREDQ
jgi:hypothetical protein